MKTYDMFWHVEITCSNYKTLRYDDQTMSYSDKPNQHDFELLKKLVLPDGSILRAKYPGRPTRDCLFDDPVMDGKRCSSFPSVNSIRELLPSIKRKYCALYNICSLSLSKEQPAEDMES